MRVVSFEAAMKMSVLEHQKPTLSPQDAILRVTTSGICGSDLHMYNGRTPAACSPSLKSRRST